MPPLDPSQRVRLIKEIVNRLSVEEWPMLDVTLRQFSLRTSDTWQGTKEGYVANMVEGGSDETLTLLASHLGYLLEKPPERMEPSFWRKGYLRLFVSHLAEQRKIAADLQSKLTEFGISAFVAHNDIEPTTEWQSEIEAALSTADTLVALLHNGFHASKWTDQEVGYAMGRSLPVFAVRFGEDPYGFIGRFQAFQGFGKTLDEVSNEIFYALAKHKQTRYRMAEALVLRVEQSESFAEAKTHAYNLQKATYWHPSFGERLRLALKSNEQLNGAWGVPDKIEQFIAASTSGA